MAVVQGKAWTIEHVEEDNDTNLVDVTFLEVLTGEDTEGQEAPAKVHTLRMADDPDLDDLERVLKAWRKLREP